MATPSEEVLKANGYGDRGCQIAHRVYESFREFCYPMMMTTKMMMMQTSSRRPSTPAMPVARACRSCHGKQNKTEIGQHSVSLRNGPLWSPWETTRQPCCSEAPRSLPTLGSVHTSGRNTPDGDVHLISGNFQVELKMPRCPSLYESTQSGGGVR